LDREERRRLLEEAVRLLGSARLDPGMVGESAFEDVQADSRVATALSAARSALALLEKEPAESGEQVVARRPINP
jgi:ATP-dependent DNA ligase